MRDEFSPRQLCALLWSALSAPLALVCSRVSWVWSLAGALGAGLLYLYIIGMCRFVPQGTGYGEMLQSAWGKGFGGFLAALNWAWLLTAAARAAEMSGAAFPNDRAFPLIPVVLLILAACVAGKSAAATARFGGLLFLFVAALLGATLIFGARDVEPRNLFPSGEPADATGPLCALLAAAAALFLRDEMDGGKSRWGRWYLLILALAAALSLVCAGALGLPLAERTQNPFWLVSRSISVLGVMERFEALTSALLSLGFCCLLALLLCAARKAAQTALPSLPVPAAVWGSAALCAGGLWFAGRIPDWAWLGGNLIFWVLLPVLTLGIVCRKYFKKIEKKLDKTSPP